MQGFTFHAPTEIVFGRDAEARAGALVKKYGGSRVFVVYGSGSAARSGLINKIAGLLESDGFKFFEFGGVSANPTLSHARRGVSEAIKFEADFILAVGGGSAIDAAKAIAHGACNREIDIWKFWKREAELVKSLPVGVVLTISAAGSETSASAVLTDGETNEKRGLSSERNRPKFALMNPELTFTLPKYQVACGVADIMMHTMDRFFTQPALNETTDEIAAAILRTVIKNGRAAIQNPSDYDAASELMWCGSLSHNGITGLGYPFDFSVHQLGHELGGRFNVAHGASLSTMWGSWANYVRDVNPARFAKFAEMVWEIHDGSDEEKSKTGIEKTVAYFKEIGMPTCFGELGIGLQDCKTIGELAESCVFYGKRLVGNFKPLDKNDVAKIYEAANRPS